MATIIYHPKEFDYEAASNGALCIMVLEGTTEDVSSDDSNTFKGAGICVRPSADVFSFKVNNVRYLFDDKGLPKSANAEGFVLKMGFIKNSYVDSSVGSAVGSDISYITVASTRGEGAQTIEYDTQKVEGETNIFVDTLNARDQFAAQALRGLLTHIEDPITLSNNEMNHYCEVAYNWAANMMSAAAKVRAILEDETGEEVPVTSLDSTTDKLLSNILNALKRTDEEDVPAGGGDPIYSERISIPALIDVLNDYLSDGNQTLGLKDLIGAINNIGSGGQSSSMSITSIPNLNISSLPNQNISSLPSLGGTINIGSSGLGRDAEHPLYIKIVVDEETMEE